MMSGGNAGWIRSKRRNPRARHRRRRRPRQPQAQRRRPRHHRKQRNRGRQRRPGPSNRGPPVPVQFSYMQQNADGSVSTQGGVAERPPTWGELQDHIASTGATLLPATPATPSLSRAQPEAAPPPEAAASPAPEWAPTRGEQAAGA